MQIKRLALFPLGSTINSHSHLVIGGCDCVELVEQFGTPLYVYDEKTIRHSAQSLKNEFRNRYPATAILYACKAFLNPALLKLMQDEDIGLDVVSGGEMAIARQCGFPMYRVSFPGNNKSETELRQAQEYGVGRIVIDNFDEIDIIDRVTRTTGHTFDVLIRISPGIDPHTHEYIATGNIDSKFGFPLLEAEEALRSATMIPGINVLGLHFHLGSQITIPDPYREAINVVIDFAARMQGKYNFRFRELSVGGGIPVQVTLERMVPPISEIAETVTASLITACRQYQLEIPQLVIEPGRVLVAQAGVALYTTGTRKAIPGIRNYVSVDGGMADNIRPYLYQERMEAVLANRMRAPFHGKVTIAGKFCESGDVLMRDYEMPEMVPGDILATSGCGAYNIPQSCNYNAFLRPAVVMVRDGNAVLIRRRETVADLVRCDNFEC